jgi:diheme cytochrome c
MTIRRDRRACAAILAGVLVAAWLSNAAADERRSRAPADPAFVSECGSCHVPYPPRLLSAASWRTVMNGLDRHFGTDATLDPATAQSIRNYLEANAGSGRKVSADPHLVRVTQSPRFARKHDGIAPAVFRSDKVQSAANCSACHPGAQDGRFSEHDARIPR